MGSIRGGRVLKGKTLILWFACNWSIWKARNLGIFQEKDILLKDIVLNNSMDGKDISELLRIKFGITISIFHFQLIFSFNSGRLLA